jgi:hypothetical protein
MAPIGVAILREHLALMRFPTGEKPRSEIGDGMWPCYANLDNHNPHKRGDRTRHVNRKSA